jgi:parvulin-like peptidyl-prolyl isomerase
MMAENLEKLAAATGLQVMASAPFSQSEQPPGLDMPEGIARSVFKLTTEEPFLDAPVITENGVYVVALQGRQPSTQPPVEEVWERVSVDYQKNQARVLANTFGADLHRKLSAALAEGKTIETAATEANAELIDLPPFSQKTQSLAEVRQADLSSIKTIAFALSPGQLSSYNQTRDSGFILYLEKRVPVTDAQLQAALPEYLKTLRQSRQYEAFSDWLRKETELAHLVIPGEKKTAAQ